MRLFKGFSALLHNILHSEKTVKARLIILLCSILTITSLAVLAPTLARYVFTVNAPFNDKGEDKDALDFTVNTVFVVYDQNDLFSAINQGYSYIQISNELTNPFVITQSPKNLKTDLILDLNGIELYRHGNEPIFEINEGVRLTITDTSETQRGCLYNPTGSVLKINGGTLTVVSGKFECGPRYSEYYTYNNNILSTKSNKRTIVDSEPHAVSFYMRNGTGTDATFTNYIIDAPIIEAYDTAYDGNEHHHGNLYFDWCVQVGAETDTSKNFMIPADTYCYYTTSDDDSYGTMKQTAYQAHWYYVYNVDPNTYSYIDSATEDSIEVTVFGYEDVIENAYTRADPNDIDKPSNDFFAAIKMFGGVFDILYGDFYNYFGVETTACIDMMGGELIIKEGNFSTRIPNATTHRHNMVDAKEDDAAAFDVYDYFNDFHWGKEDFGPSDPTYDKYKDGIRASEGKGFGILTSGDAKITIDKGNFYSSNNNLIHMQDGKLDIGGGSFYKTNTVLPTSYSHHDSVIFMHDGEFNIGEAKYYIYGDYARAIRMIDGKLNVNGATCQMLGDYTYAVYSTIPGDNLTLTDIKFDMQARTEVGRLVGIYSTRSESGESGKVTVRTSESAESHININGAGSVGIYIHGGEVDSQGCSYHIVGNNSSGIYADEGRVTINGGDITLDSQINCYGVYAITKSTDVIVDITVNNATIDVGYDETGNPTTVHHDCKACIGVFLGSANPNSKVTLNNSNVHCYEVGVALSGGDLIFSDSDSTPNNILTNRASSVAVSNGDLTFNAGGIYNLVSYNTTSGSNVNSYEMTIPYLKEVGGVYSIEAVNYRNTDGIYVNGGELKSFGTLNVTHTGLENGSKHEIQNFTSLIVTSYAIRVVGGEIKILDGTITSNSGGGICSSSDDGDGGSLIMGEKGYNGTITVTTTGEEYDRQYGPWGLATENSTNNEHSTWLNKENISGGHAIELNGGNIEIFYGVYEAYFGNGICATSDGTINVYDGEFYGWMTRNPAANGLSGKSGPAAYYGLKVMGGATVNIYGGEFSGGNGGAMVTGVDNFTNMNTDPGVGGVDNYAKVYVYGGTFGDENSVDAFNVYDASVVIFGAHSADKCDYPSDADGSGHLGLITMIADNASIATNAITDGRGWSIESDVSVYYGNYQSTVANTGPKGIWNSNAQITVYNNNNYCDYVSIGVIDANHTFTNITTTTPVHYEREE